MGLVLALTAGVGGNALLQRGGMPAPMVTGIRSPAAPASAAIKTAGLPPQATATIDQEMKRWQARLKQLETEAGGVGSGAGAAGVPSAASGDGGPRASQPAMAHRLDAEPVTPVTQLTVRAVQRELTERGYDPGPADGHIGLLTQAAIMAYEHDQGLVLTGEPSERLLRRIILGGSRDDDDIRLNKFKDGETAERLIKGVQKALASLKYAPGQVDGTLSEETSRAIREFEMDQGLVPSGRVSGRLIVRLARASGKAFVIPVR